MGTVNVTLGDGKKLNLILGQQLENAVTAVVFDFSAWQTEFGSGTLGLSVQRHGDTQPYAVVPTVSGTNATWNISELDTAYKGVGEVQVTYTVGSVVKKSTVYKFTVYRSLGENGEYPSPGQTWQEEIEEELSDVRQDLGSTKSLVGLTWFDGFYNTDDHSYTTTPYWKTSNTIPCKSGDTFVYCGKSSQVNRLVVVYYKRDGTYLSGLSNLGTDYTPITLTVPSGAEFMRVLAFTAELDMVYVKYGRNADQNPLVDYKNRIFNIEDSVGDINIASKVCYVDASVASSGNGTPSSPYKTVLEAVNAGYRNIKAKAGIYAETGQIRIDNDEFNLSLWTNKTSFDTNVPNREKIVFFNGDILSGTSSNTSITASYTPRSGSRFEQVFVSRTLAPTEQSAYALTYNVCLFLWKHGHKARRYMPVLNENYTGAEGTFTYNNGTITISRFATDNDSDLKIYISSDSPSKPFYFCENKSLYIADVAVLGAWFQGFYFEGVQKAKIYGCDFICTSHGDGVEVHDGNLELENCLASGNAQDGYGFAYYGESTLTNCSAFYSGDDGVSHHHGTKGFIVGGEYSDNVSGGITPAFGADVSINGAVCMRNENGLQYFGASGYQRRNLVATNCLSKYNTNKDIYNDGYDVAFVNCIYDTQEALYSYTNTFYN